MKFSRESLDNLVGVNPRARRKNKVDRCMNQYFKDPIIHRQIHGDKIYVPLHLDKVWNQIN
jgi:hypothetical protein